MGAYINPPDETKEEWLHRHATHVNVPGALEKIVATSFDDKGKPSTEFRLVCLIQNQRFTAAGIAYDKREYAEFARPDGRPRQWYLVKRELLTTEVAPELPNYERYYDG